MKQVTRLLRTWIAAVIALIALPLSAQTTYTVGSGTGTSSFVPMYAYYGYNYTQSLYTPAELNIPAGTVITKISFLPNTTIAPATWAAKCQDWVVFMGNTTQTTFASTSSWVPASSMSQVFQGTVSAPVAGTWLEINLTTPFVYNGGNLVIAVDENTPGYASSLPWRTFTGATNTSIYHYSDGTNNNPLSPVAASSRTNARPQLKLFAPAVCTGTPSVGTISAPAIACSGSNFTLGVTPDPFELGFVYSWESSNAMTGPWTAETPTTGTAAFSINSGTKYYRRTTTCSYNNQSATTASVAVTASQPLAGTYTVGGAGSDFSSLAAAMTALSCGMTGDVTLNVNPGTYTDVVNIGGYSNPTNAKLTIQANPSNPGVVEFTSDYTAGNYNFQLNGANNVTLRNLKITATGATAGRLIQYANANTNILIEGCTLTRNTSTSTYGIYYASSTTADKLVGTIRNNNIDAGFYTVYLNVFAGDTYKLVNNTITSTYYGVYAYARSTGGVAIIDSNTITVPVTGASGYGIYVYGTSSATIGRALVRNNRVAANYFGLTVGYTRANALAPSEVINNIVSTFDGSNTSTLRGMNFYVVENVNIYHNTVSVSGGSATAGRGVFINGINNTEVGVNFANNIVVNNGPGNVMALQSLTTPVFNTLDNNTYKGNGTVLFYAATNKATLADYQQTFVTGFESNSSMGDPEFFGANDFRVQGLAVSNNGAAVGVGLDYFGTARSTSAPDRGAHEFVYTACKLPGNLTVSERNVNSLSVAWSSINAGRLGAQVRYRPVSGGTFTKTTLLGSTSSYKAMNLMADANYEFQVRDICAVGDTGLWTDAFVGRTLCAFAPGVNFTEGLNSATLTGCYTNTSATTAKWESVTSDAYGASAASEGSGFYRVNSANNVATNPYYLELPAMSMSGTDRKQLSFDYWVGGGHAPVPFSGTLASTAPSVSPYALGWMDARTQYMVRADEMQALLGANAGSLTSLAFDVTSLPTWTAGNSIMNGYTIKVAQTNATDLGAPLPQSAFTTVFQPSGGLTVTSLGWNTHTFDAPFAWDGVSNLVFQVCFDNNGYGSTGGIRYTATSYPSIYYNYADLSTGSGCTDAMSNLGTSTLRPNMQFGFVPGAAVAALPIAHNAPLEVEVSENDGTTWTKVFSMDRTRVLATKDAWTEVKLDLANYMGDNVRVRFDGISSGSTSTSPKFGVNIDDLKLEDFVPTPCALAPTITGPNSVVLMLNTSGTATLTTSGFGGLSNCSLGASVALSFSKTSFTCADVTGTPQSVVLTASDNSGNQATKTVLVTVVDNANPVVSASTALTLSLPAAGSAVIAPSNLNVVASDNCGIQSVTLSKTVFNCNDLGANTVTITVEDNNGNTTTATAVVTVTDAISPTLNVIGTPLTLNLNASGSATLTSAAVVNGLSDNCSTPTVSLSKSTFACADKGSNVVTVTATDAAGNTTTRTVVVFVVDQIAPVITPSAAPVTVALSASGTGSTTVGALGTATDNCGTVTLTASQLSFTCADLGTKTITLTAVDASGNVKTATKTITVVDNASPVLVSTPTNVTKGTCNAVVNYDYTVTDNCGFTVTRTAGLPSGATFPLGTTTVTHAFEDAAGNVTTHSFTVTIIGASITLPNASSLCPNSPVVNLTNGQAGLVFSGPGVVNGTSFDPAQAQFGMNTLTYTFTDANNCVVNGTVGVFVNAAPAKPTVSLIAPGILDAGVIAPSYQWFYAGNAIVGATNKTQSVALYGTYEVEITNAAGCTAKSNGLNVLSNGLGEAELLSSALKVFPVPTRDALTISQTTGAKIASVQVLNLNGQLLAEIAGNSRTEVQVSLSDFAAGMYQVVVNFEGGESATRRVEKL